MSIRILFITTLLISGCSETDTKNAEQTTRDYQLVDLTHEFSEETVYWVTAREFEHSTVFEGQTDNGYYYTAYNFATAEHGGTHLDAPIHFAEGRHSVEQIDLDRCIGQGVKIDLSEKALNDLDYRISSDDLKAWEARHGAIPDGSIVLLYTGHSKYYPDKINYLGTDQKGENAVALLHFPGLAPEAAQWLVDNRTVKSLGIDTPSIDYGQSQDFKTHVILLSENIPAFENLGYLESLPATGFEVFALPMKIKGGSGAPLRIVARVPNDPNQVP